MDYSFLGVFHKLGPKKYLGPFWSAAEAKHLICNLCLRKAKPLLCVSWLLSFF